MTADEAEGSTGDSALATVDGIIYSKDKTTLLAAPAGVGASVAIASECEAIAPGAFWGNRALKTIVAPGAVGSIASGIASPDALAEALDADAVDIAIASFPEGVTSDATVVTSERTAWEAAGFTRFADPARPGDTAEQDGFAFTLLDDFTLSVAWAGEGAAPEELVIPATGSLNDVEYAVSAIGDGAFAGQESIRSLSVPEGISSLGSSSFAACTGLERAQLAGSISSIGDAAFEGCVALAEASLGGGVRTIGASAFEQTALSSVVLPASVRSIGERAFAADAALARIVALSDIPEVDATALADCTGIEIYAPYREDGAYAWAPGVPATGNHLMPYGIELASEPLVLGQDQGADLLEGGRLEAPGGVEVLYSYNAAPISVDVATAQVSAKQTGKTTVTATLSLADTTLASASRPVVVEAAPSKETEKEEDVEETPPSEIVGENGETAEELKELHTPDIPYDEQFYREGDFFEGGIFEAQEKVINRTVALADMGTSPMSLEFETASVGDYSKQVSTAAKGMLVQYTADTRTLTLKYTGGYLYTGHTSETASSGSTNRVWRLTNNRMLAIRHVVVENMQDQNSEFVFANMPNLESISFSGALHIGFGAESSSSYGTARRMFWNCYSLRVLPSSLSINSATDTTEIFGFDSTYRSRLSTSKQLDNDKLLTSYSGTSNTVKKAINSTSSGTEIRKLTTSYYTVTFDNQDGTGGHQTAGESTSASNKTYTIKVPSGSPVPELARTPTYYPWAFGGYVDNLNNTPKQFVSTWGHPGNPSFKVTSDMTLKAFWYKNAGFSAGYGASLEDNRSWHVTLPKGYTVAKPSGFSFTGQDLDLWEMTSISASGRVEKLDRIQAPTATHENGLTLKGYGASSNPYETKVFYDANRNGTSQVYNGENILYAMWGYYTINFYSNVELSWTCEDKYRNNGGHSYGTPKTGTSGANYTSAFTVTDAYSYTRWNSGFFNIRNSGTAYPSTSVGDPNNYAINYRDVTWTAPAFQTLQSIKLGSATGTDIAATNSFWDFHNLTSNVSIYLTFADTTPTDTFTFKVNGGKWSDGTTADKTSTARRGTAISVPTAPSRAATPQYNYTFAGWSTDSSATSGSTSLGNANGSATYYAIWTASTIKYTITWRLSGAGSYWDNNTNDVGDKTTSVDYGSMPSAPATPKRTQTAEYNYTFKEWTPKIDKVTGAQTYVATWTETKRSYDITWKLNGAGAYWGDNMSDTGDKKVSWEYGKTPTQPAAPKRKSTAEFEYAFAGWNPEIDKVTGTATYTATWTETKRKYDITWSANGGYWGTNKADTANKSSKAQTYGTKLTGPSNGAPKKDHYTFVGWATSSTASSGVSEITVGGPATYYAVWGLPYGFTVDPGGGEFKASDLGLSGRSSQYLWTNDFRVVGNSLRLNVRKADGTYTNLVYLNGSNMERPGYTFTGWKWGNTVSNNNTNTGLVAGATYVAQWSENDVTVQYKVGTAGGGSVSRSTETVKAQTGTLAGSAARHSTGWHFIGWNTKADGSGQTLSTAEGSAWAPSKQAVSGWSYSLNVSGTYYAIFAPNDYTIELMNNDGTGADGTGTVVGSVAAKYDTPWTVRAGNVPARRGYYFIGWDTDPAYKGMTPAFPHGPNASGAFEDKEFTANLTTAEDGSGNATPTTVRLYAIWNESRYTIVFHENWGGDTTGTGSVPARIDALYTQQVEIPTNDLARTGYNFANWNTAPDGTGATYKTRGKYTCVGLAELDDAHVRGAIVHLYAQWDANQYIVQFDPNIVVSDPADKGEWHIEQGEEVLLVRYGDEVPLETVFSRPGYEFVGWSFDKNVDADADDTPIVDFKMRADGTFDPATFTNLTTDKLGLVRLYAQWKGGTYTIAFDGNASADRPVEVGPGGAMGELPMRFGVAKRLPANTFVCNGFTFKGWNTEPDGSGEAYLDKALVQDVPGVADGRVVLYAQWSPILSMTSPIDACIEVYIDGMDMYVYEVRAASAGKWPDGTPNGDGEKDDHEDAFEHGQAAIESRTPARLFIEQIDCIPNLDAEAGMARIFPVDGTPELDSWEDFELEFTALNEETGKRVKAATEFGNSYAFVPGAKNNYFVPAYDAATDTPGTLDYTLLLRIPEDEARKPNTVRYAEGPVKIATLVFTCRVAD